MSSVIALVDDDQNILTSVSMALRAEGFEVRTYKNGEEGLQGITGNPPDLAVLDIKMPRLDGLELLTRLRQQDVDIPVIFLTSKDDEVDELLGLRIGADDYIKKPFSQRLLIERIRALLRRRKAWDEQDQYRGDDSDDRGQDKIVRGALELDEKRYLCNWGGEELNLTVTEFLLLKALAERPGVVKNRDQLIDVAYGENVFVDDRTIDSHIKRLRKKFRDIDKGFNRIETMYGAGYRYKDD